MGHTTTPEILAAARALGPTIEAAADEIDERRCLPEHIVEGLRAAGVFRIAFPASWGGPEMPILDQVRLIEALAYHDASTAWVAMSRTCPRCRSAAPAGWSTTCASSPARRSRCRR